MDLTVKRTRGVLVRACDSGQHNEHDGLTCADADALINAEQAMLTAAVDRAIRAVLRGSNWKGTP